MYLFARSTTINTDKALEAIAFSTEICAEVTAISGLEVHAWSVLYGAPINTVTWTSMVESHAAMGAVAEKLQADAGYAARSAQAPELFAGAPEDTFSEVIATVNESDALGTYASVITAQCAPGKIAEAMGWGVDIFNHVGKVTGRPGILARGMYGPWATMAWISLADSLAQVDAANAAMTSDPGYIEMIDQGGALFNAGSGEGSLSQRLV